MPSNRPFYTLSINMFILWNKNLLIENWWLCVCLCFCVAHSERVWLNISVVICMQWVNILRRRRPSCQYIYEICSLSLCVCALFSVFCATFACICSYIPIDDKKRLYFITLSCITICFFSKVFHFGYALWHQFSPTGVLVMVLTLLWLHYIFVLYCFVVYMCGSGSLAFFISLFIALRSIYFRLLPRWLLVNVSNDPSIDRSFFLYKYCILYTISCDCMRRFVCIKGIVPVASQSTIYPNKYTKYLYIVHVVHVIDERRAYV